MSTFLSRYLPLLTLGAALAFLAAIMIPHGDPSEAEQLQQFAKLPVQYGGRTQPIDSLARNSLMIISGKQTFRDEEGKSQPAVRWLLDLMSARAVLNRNLAAASRFYIPSAALRQQLDLPTRAGDVYDANEFTQDSVRNLVREAIRVEQVDAAQRTAVDRQVLAIAHQLREYLELKRIERNSPPEVNGICAKYKVFKIENDQLLTMLNLEPRLGLRYSIDEFRARMAKIDDASKHARDLDTKQRDAFDVKILDLRQHLELYLELGLQLKPQAVRTDSGTWKSLADLRETNDPNAAAFERMLIAHSEKKPDQFNEALATYAKTMKEQAPEAVWKAKLEAFLNHADPFMCCEALYFCVFMLALLGFVFLVLYMPAVFRPINRSAFWLLILTLCVHTGGLLARCAISGRPPVTNLFSSAIFIGWGAVIGALVLERLFPIGIGNLVGSAIGLGTAIIADHLLNSGDTMEMLQAVLDTNFWLATHVVCVTLGYTATFVAGFLGIVYVALGVATPVMNIPLSRIFGEAAPAAWKNTNVTLGQLLSQMVYGVVCFATLLSFVGTVLGGIWADQSWGRFWGWDPKENGALLIVIWNALILHARWGGMVKQRGMAVLTIVGNMVTLWSWFGTNQLSVGLHAYGFSNALAATLTVAWGVHIILIGVGLLPTKFWWSFSAQEPPPHGRRRGGRPEPQPV